MSSISGGQKGAGGGAQAPAGGRHGCHSVRGPAQHRGPALQSQADDMAGITPDRNTQAGWPRAEY